MNEFASFARESPTSAENSKQPENEMPESKNSLGTDQINQRNRDK